MGRIVRSAVRPGAAVQVGGAILAFLLLAAVPPAEGRMLVLPLSAGAARRTPALVVGTGARLMGAGPVAGSLVVWGTRRLLLHPLAKAGALLVAAPPAACGEDVEPAG